MAKWQDRTEADIVAWWSPEDGKPIVGEVVGLRAITRGDGKRTPVWVIETSESTMARVKGDETPNEYPPGTIIGVGHRAKLAPLAELYATTERFDVAINPGKKIKLQGGRTMWLLQLKTRGGTARQVALNPASIIPKQLGPMSGPPPVDNGEDADDDIPF